MQKIKIISFLTAAYVLTFPPAFAEENSKNSYSADELGIILQAHPDKPEFDNSDKPLILSGAVSTKIESVEFPDRGPFTVEVASGLNIQDKKRKKLIPIEAAYPKESGNFPVIVFSHAAIASGRDYRPLAAFWASHGYITILPTHDDALTLHVKPGEKVSVIKLIKLSKVDGKTLNGRKDDIARVLDSLPSLSARIKGLEDKVNNEKIAIVGHHSGAFACQMLSGVDYKNKTATDRRVDAAIFFKGINWRLPSVKKQDWTQVEIPTMLVSFSGGIKDISKLRKNMQEAVGSSKSSAKYFVTIDSDREKKPSRAKVRRMLKDSNITLIGFRPFQRLKNRRENRKSRLNPESKPQVNDANLNELPGQELLGILGISPLNKSANKSERFKFAMSTTLPFLNAYLKDSTEDLNLLESTTEKHFDNEIVVRVNRL